MDKTPLFQEIAENIRQDILFGNLKPGDELPAVRKMAQLMKCAPGTVQKAYQELIHQGLVLSRPGQGTRVALPPSAQSKSPFRDATLIHETETFILGQIKSGHATTEIEKAFQIAMDRWRAIAGPKSNHADEKLRFVGSHDMAMTLLNQHLEKNTQNLSLSLKYAGSLGGLIALARQEADIAGCHLWDRESNDYNRPYIQRLLPGRKIGLLTLAHRRLGLIISKKNPKRIVGIQDLSRKDLRFLNRQPGAGTRVWLDVQLQLLSIQPSQIQGYEDSVLTHSEAASAIEANVADLTLGIESAAIAYGLDFIPLTIEQYELVIPAEFMVNPCVQMIMDTLSSDTFKTSVNVLGGYVTERTGDFRWVE